MANTSSEEMAETFRRIRIRFLFNHPFLSVLALSLPTVFAENPFSAFTTNGERITVDVDKLAGYNEEEITYLYAHTLMHVVLKHPWRAKQRDLESWNQASNIVVNVILSSFSSIGNRPDDEVLDPEMKDRSVEEVYELLQQQNKQEKEEPVITAGKDESGNETQADRHSKTKLDLEENNEKQRGSKEQEKLDNIIIKALTIAQQNPGKYSGMNIEIDTLIKPEIDLSDILKEYLITSFFEKVATFDRPNRRYIANNLYLPGNRKSQELIDLYIALDSSSSVTLDEYKKFLGVTREVCGGFYEYRITLLPFDRAVKTEHIIEFDHLNPLTEDDLFIPKSDGGTDFDNVLRYLRDVDVRPDNLLVVLSDGEFEITEHLVCETLFIISQAKNLSKFEPYGRVVQFKI